MTVASWSISPKGSLFADIKSDNTAQSRKKIIKIVSMHLNKVHHIAIICSNYERSKRFYTEVLGLEVMAEHFRETRQSWKADLSLNGSYVIELFSFPSPPPRPSYPEAVGLRHLAFEVDDIEAAEHELTEKGIAHEPIRMDEYTHKRFVFFSDPDDLPIELYER